LRALAVLSVIFHHYLVPGFSGGFVGVDVFFVISGFLIAAHIEGDLATHGFSLRAFYERRIRRILPALFLMYGLFVVSASRIYFPPDLHFQTQLAVYVIPFLANYAFYQNAGNYSGEFAAHIGLLHTWSLAVEEQFYLFFPLLMLAIARFARSRYTTILWPMALASFLACAIASYLAPSAAFYLAPYRAWELLAGALLAVGRFSPPRDSRVRAAVAAVGLMLIAGADLLLSKSTPYPGAWATVPCAGAAAILFASCDRTVSVVGRALDNGVMRRIGLWSYSLYLFHWPILVLAQYYFLDPLSVSMRCVLLACTFPLGALSWRYVEQPFRGAGALLSRPVLYGAAATLALSAVAATVVLHRAEDPQRYSTREQALFPGYTVQQARCKNASPEIALMPACKLGDPGAPAAAVLWGDSHALAILPAVDAAYAKHHEAAIFAEQGGCPPLLGVHVRDLSAARSSLARTWIETHGFSRRCERHTDELLNWVVRSHIRTVVLAAHWIAYTEGNHSRWLTDGESPDNFSMQENAAVFERGLERLLAALERGNIQVFIMEDVPQSSVNVPYALAAAKRLHVDRDFRISRAAYETQQHSAAAVFARLRKGYSFQTLKPQDLLCEDGMCSLTRNDALLYSDAEHVSEPGAMICEPALESIWDARS
jgi:peptidoglycan/LPS O-acetylase OafA/YrhL